MSGHRPFAGLRTEIDADPERAARVRALEERLNAEQAAYDRAVSEVRRARAYTHEQLARALGMSRTQVARIEDQAALYLATLQSYFEAMGGELGIATTVGNTHSVLAVTELFTDAPALSAPESASA